MPAMPDSPIARHSATPAELRERIEAERHGSPFLVLRDGTGRQTIVHLGGTAERPRVLAEALQSGIVAPREL
jgi:hypothetical protein